MPLRPETPKQLAEALAAGASEKQSIRLGGAFTKERLGGPVTAPGVTISTAGLDRALEYEPNDLTISVEAGMTYAALSRLLAEHRQMVPLDPPYAERATIGGIVAANSSGPRRRLYGTARDLVIGMTFATLEGKLVRSGGMVVKNVAGLDLAKLMIGSWGTLAAIAVVNLRLHPAPACSRTFVLEFSSVAEAIAARDAVFASVLQPAAIDLLNPAAAARIGRGGWLLLIRAQGSRMVVERYSRTFAGVASLEGDAEESLWERVREFTPEFLATHAEGAVVRVSATHTALQSVIGSIRGPAIARAGSGVCYGCFEVCQTACDWLKESTGRGWPGVIESGPPEECTAEQRWPAPGGDLAIMERIKRMFDPHHLLNRGRMYGRL